MKNIQALIFDLDNTLMDRNHSIAQMHKWLVNAYLELPLRDKALELLRMWDYHGYASHEVVLRNFVKTFGIDLNIKDTANYFRDNQGSHAILIDDAVETLEYFAKDYKLGLLTNGPSYGQSLKINTAFGDKQQLFDAIVICGDLGYHKPDPRTYHMICHKLDLKPEQCVYIGDDLLNDVIAPMKVGMKAIRFNKDNLLPTRLTNEVTSLKQLQAIDIQSLSIP